jgi:cyclophilin family peptidyl-prolyl cis-trans isomerase
MRRLPLEVESQNNGLAAHKKWMLTMARDVAPDSAVSSFSVLLGDAPHLNKKYTVFGRLLPDDVTLGTLDRITREWETSHPWIIKATEM